ncbi:hypothetical protein [Microcystis phage Me-ZS1]|nr:hypothetical protein [Microcystis phage Me-ZS1]
MSARKRPTYTVAARDTAKLVRTFTIRRDAESPTAMVNN